MNLLFVRMRQELDRSAAPRALSIATMAGLFLALLGPVGTSTAPLASRLVYWLSLAEIGTVIAIAIGMVIRRLVDPAEKRVFVVAVLTALAVTPPVAVVVFEITKHFFQDNRSGAGFEPSGGLLGFIPPVLAISLALSLINALAYRRPVQTHAAPPGGPPSRFEERLPARLREGELYAIQAEDHYLRLYTSRGSDLILMRLADAIAELEGVDGAQTHRSWWVAKKAVLGARRLNARAILQLPGDIEAPVSRTFTSALRKQGWF